MKEVLFVVVNLSKVLPNDEGKSKSELFNIWFARLQDTYIVHQLVKVDYIPRRDSFECIVVVEKR